MELAQGGPAEAIPEEINTVTGHSDRVNAKRVIIRQACHDKDIDRLVSLANSTDGLVDDDLRRLAWPLFLNVETNAVETEKTQQWQSEPPHRDEEQIEKDVDRAFVYYPNNESQTQLNEKRRKLSRLITRIFRSHRMLYYFQGYHDIAQVMLLVLGEQDAYAALARLSLFRIRDYMLHSISPAVKHLHLIPAILRQADPNLAQHLAGNRPIFALANALTLYAHDIQEYSDIARLYDFLLAHEPVMSIYVFASIVISRRDELLEIPPEDQDMLQFTLQKLPRPLSLQDHIDRALQLFGGHPPEALPGRVWAHISHASVLKASRDIKTRQTTEDATRLFMRQEKELKREETVHKAWRYVLKNRRPVLSIMAAILFGVASVWLRKTGTDRVLLTTMHRVLHM